MQIIFIEIQVSGPRKADKSNLKLRSSTACCEHRHMHSVISFISTYSIHKYYLLNLKDCLSFVWINYINTLNIIKTLCFWRSVFFFCFLFYSSLLNRKQMKTRLSKDSVPQLALISMRYKSKPVIFFYLEFQSSIETIINKHEVMNPLNWFQYKR